MSHRYWYCNLVKALGVLWCLSFGYCWAGVDDENQVYTDDINAPGDYGLELHNYYVMDGTTRPAYRGDLPSQGTYRLTAEASYGLTDTFELGAYLPLSQRYGSFYVDGGKLRLKYLKKQESGVFFGLNTEIGRVSRRLSEKHWNMELRPIFGYRDDDWLLSFNPVLSIALVGAKAGIPSFEPSLKLGRHVGHGVFLGVEHLADIGAFNQVPGLAKQSHVTYLATDMVVHGVDVNIGIGRGWTSAADRWMVKMIVGF